MVKLDDNAGLNVLQTDSLLLVGEAVSGSGLVRHPPLPASIWGATIFPPHSGIQSPELRTIAPLPIIAGEAL